jgi:hypothetical protein
MRWKLLISFLFIACGLFSSNSKKSEEESVSNESQMEPILIVEKAEWKKLEQMWLVLHLKRNGRYALELPCDGDGKVLIFSNRQGKAFFSLISGEETIIETEISAFSHQQGNFTLDAPTGKEYQFHLEEGMLQFNDELFIAERKSDGLEKVYRPDKECGFEEQLSLSKTQAKDLVGNWRDKDCGPTVISITENSFDFGGDKDPIVAFNKEDDKTYWLTLQNGKFMNAIKIQRKQEDLLVWNGVSSVWAPIELTPAKKCKQK